MLFNLNTDKFHHLLSFRTRKKFYMFETLSQTINFRLKEFAHDNFNFDEYGRKFSKQVENTVGKGEIACYEQFLLFPQCFQKTCTADI